MAESFRADDLYGIIDEVIEEMSFMSHGAVDVSAAGPRKKGGFSSAVPAEPAARKEDKKKKKKKVKKKVIPEGMVEQVLNYLLNKEAPL